MYMNNKYDLKSNSTVSQMSNFVVSLQDELEEANEEISKLKTEQKERSKIYEDNFKQIQKIKKEKS